MDAELDGTHNVAIGVDALGAGTDGDYNVCIGNFVYAAATDSGAFNTAVGYAATYENNAAGDNNAMYGAYAGRKLTGGSGNTCIGAFALQNLTGGDDNTVLGKDAGTTGNPGGNVTTHSDHLIVGNDHTLSAYVKVSWTVTSDERDKTDFKDLDVGLNFIKALEPVTFYWDERAKYVDTTDPDCDLNKVTHDGTHKGDRIDIGFKAQAVEKLEEAAGYKIADKTNLTTTLTADGKQYGLKYERFVPILVKAVQELSDQVTDLKEQLDKCNCE